MPNADNSELNHNFKAELIVAHGTEKVTIPLPDYPHASNSFEFDERDEYFPIGLNLDVKEVGYHYDLIVGRRLVRVLDDLSSYITRALRVAIVNDKQFRALSTMIDREFDLALQELSRDDGSVV